MTTVATNNLVLKNKQGIFDRQLEMCATFVNLNCSSSSRVFDYNVDNNFIEICVFYGKICDWCPQTGKKQIIDLVKHYKLHLLGYELNKISFTRNIGCNNRYKHTCKYLVPLNLLKFSYNIFYFDENYLTYEKIGRQETFKLFLT